MYQWYLHFRCRARCAEVIEAIGFGVPQALAAGPPVGFDMVGFSLSRLVIGPYWAHGRYNDGHALADGDLDSGFMRSLIIVTSAARSSLWSYVASCGLQMVQSFCSWDAWLNQVAVAMKSNRGYLLELTLLFR